MVFIRNGKDTQKQLEQYFSSSVVQSGDAMRRLSAGDDVSSWAMKLQNLSQKQFSLFAFTKQRKDIFKVTTIASIVNTVC